MKKSRFSEEQIVKALQEHEIGGKTIVAISRELGIAQASLSNYQRLYSGERLKFEVGESTLFILNSRQNKVIEAAQKVAELAAKRQKAEAGLYFAAGILEWKSHTASVQLKRPIQVLFLTCLPSVQSTHDQMRKESNQRFHVFLPTEISEPR